MMKEKICLKKSLNFIVIGPNYYNYSYSTVETLKNIGYRVKFFDEKAFYDNCNYIQRKLYKQGIKKIKKRWDDHWNKELIDYVEENSNQDTILLFLSGGEIIKSYTLSNLVAYKKILILWDSVKRNSLSWQKQLTMYDKIYLFEFEDMAYLKNKFGLMNVEYMPLGYDKKIYVPKDVPQDIDISFVGARTEKRLRLLNWLSIYAYKNKKKLLIVGKWFNNRWPWQKMAFRKKYPYLSRYLVNHNIDPIKTADIYQRSKIVLNINNDVHKSISPRTFEILATKSFQIMNNGQQSNNTLDLDKDLVEFTSNDDLVHKIEYYLSNEKKRRAIAECGYQDVKKFSLEMLLNKFIDNLQDNFKNGKE